MIGNVAALMSGLLFLLRVVYMVLEMHDRYNSKEIERRMEELKEAQEEDAEEWERHKILVDRMESLLKRNKADRDKSEK